MTPSPATPDLEGSLGYRFRDSDLLHTALTHRSLAHESTEDSARHYERLEFLGDALLGLVVSDWLYRDDEEAPEGHLSRRRQGVVRASALAEAAIDLGLDDAIRLGRGEERSGGRAKVSLLADVFEAVLGAIYIDGGIRPARAFVKRALGEKLQATRESGETSDDYKTRLQERLQQRLRQTPRYRIVSTTGPDHALQFEVEVLIEDRILARGDGSSRKAAEQEAARHALETDTQED